jgi:hypothetical protein
MKAVAFLIAGLVCVCLGILSVFLWNANRNKTSPAASGPGPQTPATAPSGTPAKVPSGQKKMTKVVTEDNDDAGDERVAHAIALQSEEKDQADRRPPSGEDCPPFPSGRLQNRFVGATASIRDPKTGLPKMRGDTLAKDFVCAPGRKTYPIGNVRYRLAPLRAIDVTRSFSAVKETLRKDWDKLNVEDFNAFDVPVTGLCGDKDPIDPLLNPVVTCRLHVEECKLRTPFETVAWNVRADTGRTTVHQTSYSERFFPRDMCIKTYERDGPSEQDKRRMYFWRCTRSANKLLETILSLKGKGHVTKGGLKVLDIDTYVADNIDRSWNHKIAELEPSHKAAGIAGGAYVRIKYTLTNPWPVICHELAHVGAGGHGAPFFEYTQYKLQMLAYELQKDGLLGDDFFVNDSQTTRVNMTARPKGEPPSGEPVACGYRGNDGKGYFCW